MSSQLGRLLESERAAGIALLCAAIAAVFVANSGFRFVYEAALFYRLGPMNLHDWVSDGLMAVFFFGVGHELRREMQTGVLSSADRAALPLIGAFGGMIVPALIYLTFVHTGHEIRGCGIPIATDIAFAVGTLSLLGRRAPTSLKVFLLALAVSDDLGAILVIALFYTETINWFALLIAIVGIGTTWLIGNWRMPLTWLLVLFVWWCFVRSGIHATVAGCLLGLVLPVSPRYESGLRIFAQFFVMPIFAFANAGLSFEGASLSAMLASPIVSGVGIGLFAGKPFGIFGASILAVKMGWARLDASFSRVLLFGLSCLGGIGFTMSLFISSLALPSGEMDFARLGIVLGSISSAMLGLMILHFSLESDGRRVSN